MCRKERGRRKRRGSSKCISIHSRRKRKQRSGKQNICGFVHFTVLECTEGAGDLWGGNTSIHTFKLKTTECLSCSHVLQHFGWKRSVWGFFIYILYKSLKNVMGKLMFPFYNNKASHLKLWPTMSQTLMPSGVLERKVSIVPLHQWMRN